MSLQQNTFIKNIGNDHFFDHELTSFSIKILDTYPEFVYGLLSYCKTLL